MSQQVPILLNLFAAFIGAFGQFLYKAGALRLKDVPIYLNWQIILGVILYISVMFIFIVAFKMGGKLSVVYPVYATTFIWGTLIGIFYDKEGWNFIQLAGIIFVIVGISMVAVFSPQN